MVNVGGKLIEVGMLDEGRGIRLECNGEEVVLIGLEIPEVKLLAALLNERVSITIAAA